LKNNYKNPFVLEKQTIHVDETIRIELPNQVSFLNKASIKTTLWAIPNHSKVIIDATYCDFIDDDILEIINDYKTTISVNKGIKLNIIGLKPQYQLDDHIQFINVLDKATQQKLHPNEVLTILKKGNERFVSGKWTNKYLKHQINATSFGQNPLAVVLSCIDSRTTTEHIFDLGLGDIFSIRIAGNILNDDILGSMELATKIIGTKLIVVLGHTKCGAIMEACNHVQMGHVTTLLDKVKPAMEKANMALEKSSPATYVQKVTELNVHLTIERIRKESSIIAALEQAGKVKIIGGLYDLDTGVVKFYEGKGDFAPRFSELELSMN
jgi:carbonic anhydrase/SulP family sulfate permease